ncbi:hypothetical protein [Corynebacterium sp. AOP12-C2-36]|uniref:hypothetical protein n=1 Tax=Corynebacterium sp. AOP12-C2-36 TaxID=3457723 RepID=UPI004034049A
MPKPCTDYVYVASRIAPEDDQNLGDYAIRRRLPDPWTDRDGNLRYSHILYEYNSSKSRLMQRNTDAMRVIGHTGAIRTECMKAIDRLHAEEAAAA